MTEETAKLLATVQGGTVPAEYTKVWHLMPEDWKDVPLSHIFKKKSQKNKGNNLKTVFTNSAVNGIIPQSEYFEKDIANPENTEGYFVVDPLDYVYNPRISENAPYGPFKRNDTGLTGIVSPLYTVLTPRKEFAKSEFLHYYLESAQWHKYAYSIANYGARFDRMNITDDELMRLPIAWPSLPEQERIAEILMQCDKVIELKQKRIEEEKKKKQYLLSALVYSTDKETEYQPTNLEELCAFISDGDWIESKDQRSEGIRLIQTGNIGVNRYLPKDDRARYISERSFESLNCTEVFNGDLLVSRLPDPIGRVCRVEGISSRAITAVDCTILRFKSEITADWFLQFASSEQYLHKIEVLAGGSTRTRISKKELTQLKFMVPSLLQKQKDIVDMLSSQDSVIWTLEAELVGWVKKKKALSQLLLTGIVRTIA